ncbi:MAG: 30S ribosome-binding factor RbfA [Bacteroidota bacterium]|mgnify:CR=1 FL=1
MSVRAEKVGSLIKEEISVIIQRNLSDSSDGFITVTDVRMSRDLRIAKVYVSILGAPDVKEKTLKMIEANKKEIRSLIGSRIRLKFTPELHFYLDETLDRVEAINNLIKRIHNEK